MRAFLKLLLTVAIVWGIVHFWPWRAIVHPPGVLTAEDPIQKDIPPRFLTKVKDYTLVAMASYQLKARVLHTKRYWADGADLVPYDVALGWGRMSDQSILDHLQISQGNRFYFYEWMNVPPLPEKEMICHSSNNHVIAANSQVSHVVSSLRAGQIVLMKGWLVNVTGGDGFHWSTSLRRDDTGNGACEVFYVESAEAADEPGQLPELVKEPVAAAVGAVKKG